MRNHTNVNFGRLVAVTATLGLLWGTVQAQSQPLPLPAQARVIDQTSTLTATEIKALDTKLKTMEQQRGDKVAIVMVPTTRPESMEEYATRAHKAWNPSRQGADNYLLLLVAKDDQTAVIEGGSDQKLKLSDSSATRLIQESMMPSFQKGQYYQGLTQTTERLDSLMAGKTMSATTPAMDHDASNQTMNRGDGSMNNKSMNSTSNSGMDYDRSNQATGGSSSSGSTNGSSTGSSATSSTGYGSSSQTPGTTGSMNSTSRSPTASGTGYGSSNQTSGGTTGSMNSTSGSSTTPSTGYGSSNQSTERVDGLMDRKPLGSSTNGMDYDAPNQTTGQGTGLTGSRTTESSDNQGLYYGGLTNQATADRDGIREGSLVDASTDADAEGITFRDWAPWAALALLLLGMYAYFSRRRDSDSDRLSSSHGSRSALSSSETRHN